MISIITWAQIMIIMWFFICLEWDVIIKNRVVGFTWCNDLIVFPDDPYGREGPKLNEILYKPKSADKDSESENIE